MSLILFSGLFMLRRLAAFQEICHFLAAFRQPELKLTPKRIRSHHVADDPHHLLLLPATHIPGPLEWMVPFGLLIHGCAFPADRCCLTTVTLLGLQGLEAGGVVPMVLRVNKRRHPLAALLLAGKWPSRVVRSIFQSP